MTAHTVDLANEAKTEILRLFSRHQALTDQADKHIETGDQDEDGQRFASEIADLEEKMMALPSTCAADFAAKAIAVSGRGQIVPNWDQDPLWIEARALVEQGATPTIPATRHERLKFAAATLGIDLPDNLTPDLLAEDAAPQTEVLKFCAASGVSLDFIYMGDIRPMLRGTFARRFDHHRHQAKPRTDAAAEEITNYLDGLQRKAVKARALLEAIGALGDEPDEEDTLFEVIDTATRLLSSMDRELDAISRPAALGS